MGKSPLIVKSVKVPHELAERIKVYKFLAQHKNEGEALRALLVLGLAHAPEVKDAEARQQAQRAVFVRMTEAWLEEKAEAPKQEQPDKLLRGAEELFTDDAQLRGGVRRVGDKKGN
jgi:hypothetical protein